MRTIAAIAILLIACTSAQAGIYRWVDDNGQVHYGTQPPSGVQATSMDVRSASGSAPAATEQERAKERSQPAHEGNCKIAQQNLEVLQDERVASFQDAEGNIVEYSAEERTAMIEQAQKQVDAFC